MCDPFQTVNNVTKAHRVNEVNVFATFSIVYNTKGRCSYCGSLSPDDLAEAIRRGVTVEWADMKYGFPHKLYLSNPYKGAIKFYTVHLLNTLPDSETYETIARACGLRIYFDTQTPGDIKWEKYKAK